MKGIKIFSVIALSALLIVGWVTFAVKNISTVTTAHANVSTADQYVDEGLYQRAILKYKEALAEKDSDEIWTKMFNAYELRYQEDANILSDYIADLQSALKLYPKNIDFIKKLCDLYMVSNDIKSTYQCLNTAIENGVKDDDIIKKVKELKYSFELDYNTFLEYKSLSDNMYAVYNGDKWGYIDTAGEEVLDYVYSYVSSCNNEGVRIITNSLGCRLYDESGMVLGIFTFNVTDAGLFTDNLIPVSDGKEYGYYDSFAKKQFGGYEYAGSFQNGIAAVKKSGQWTLIDTSGKEKSGKFADIVVDGNGQYLNGEVMIAATAENKYQMFDSEGKSINDFTANKMDICTSDGCIAFEKDGKWGFVDTSGKVVIEPLYDEAKSFSNGLAAVCKDGKWGFINSSNEVVIDYQFAGADYFNSNGSCIVRSDAANADDPVMHQLLILNFGV